MDNLIATANELIDRAHAGQVDKAGLPYVGHLRRVASYIVSEDPLAITTALLHDSLEDTSLSVADLVDCGFPAPVIEAVKILTRSSGQPPEDYYRTIRQNPLAREVKLADLADNSDPARLNQLSDATQARLRRKYSAAYKSLGVNQSDGDRRRRFRSRSDT
ncbi:guanosine-3',5'-bis(diphosphate) 3'-pyrophosphohydrolase [Mycobacterium sp. TNTM28]|uniref:Guanosine-3',5'-bis(Diphosphate) 3'-pyrophosphohydrolase n=1 Tax=[Mycobacterium] fortunisiensis TaxID=2600579 RepID=A0ABS6KGN2_9MYCO|nr:guanosine-3',5'-bis(diphosphate) 3'-pyrophosphohydrolase [[Mycobacterium] fortunisiensis]MBU9762718.1 guanosine-3',5'-bis(diphosphate) 3'-pyrophosphohydrolase [[Mycobacterium] fortunisiensis]